MFIVADLVSLKETVKFDVCYNPSTDFGAIAPYQSNFGQKYEYTGFLLKGCGMDLQSNLNYLKCQGPQESFRIIGSSDD